MIAFNRQWVHFRVTTVMDVFPPDTSGLNARIFIPAH